MKALEDGNVSDSAAASPPMKALEDGNASESAAASPPTLPDTTSGDALMSYLHLLVDSFCFVLNPENEK